jgi:hypothetical protein
MFALCRDACALMDITLCRSRSCYEQVLVDRHEVLRGLVSNQEHSHCNRPVVLDMARHRLDRLGEHPVSHQQRAAELGGQL